jgi:hypothetical protein
MSNDIRIIRAHDFIRATPEGRLDFEASKQLLIEVASAATGLVNYEILLDMRMAVPELTTADLWYLAMEASQLGTTYRHKTAVLCLLEQFADAEFFALSGKNRGFQIRAITSFEDASEWLIAAGN